MLGLHIKEFIFFPASIILGKKNIWLLLILRWAFLKVPKCVYKYILAEKSAYIVL